MLFLDDLYTCVLLLYLLLNNGYLGFFRLFDLGFKLYSLETSLFTLTFPLDFKLGLFLLSLSPQTLISFLLRRLECLCTLLLSNLGILLHFLEVLLLLGCFGSLAFQLEFLLFLYLYKLKLVQLDLVLNAVPLLLESRLPLDGALCQLLLR